MFCPRCSTENAESTKYCRTCGLSLASLQLILDRHLDEITEKVKKGEGILSGGAVTLIIFCLVAILSIIMDNGRSLSAFINLILGLLISAPMIVVGIKRLERAKKLIEGGLKPGAIDARAVKQLPTAPTTDRGLTLPQTLASVTEHTTYELSEPDDSPAQSLPRDG